MIEPRHTASEWTPEKIHQRVTHAEDHGTRLPVFTIGGPLDGETQLLTHIQWSIWIGHQENPFMLDTVCCAPGTRPQNFSNPAFTWLGKYQYNPVDESLAWVPEQAYFAWEIAARNISREARS